jgi:hypothetical protein
MLSGGGGIIKLMEEIKLEENKSENIQKNEQIPASPKVAAITADTLTKDISDTTLEIQKHEGVVTSTTREVNAVRSDLGLTGEETVIPSLQTNKQVIVDLEKRKIELEIKLQEILKYNVAEKYEDIIAEVKQSKIDWAHSSELARRLRLRNATDEDVEQIRNWLVDNTTGAKTFILTADKFKEVVAVLHEMTGEENIKEGKAFHVPGGRTDVPEDIKSSIFIKENQARPPLPGQTELPSESIDRQSLHHEMGHVAQDGLLESELYSDWKPVFKENAPDKDYIGLLNETDTRIQAMYRDLGPNFNPQKELFGKKQLIELREKLNKGQLNNDTKDLFDHYDDATLIKLANRLPAI